MTKALKTLILLVLLLSTATAKAQSACDKLYQQAANAENAGTDESLKKAIALYQKAKACYDSPANKKKCDTQIAVCRKKLKPDPKPKPKPTPKPKPVADDVVDDSVAIAPVKQEPVAEPVKIGFSEDVVRFGGKGGEFKKVVVNCNYDDWTLTGYPDWLNVSINSEKELVLESTPYKGKNERIGRIDIKCHGVSVSLNIIQEKKRLIKIKL